MVFPDFFQTKVTFGTAAASQERRADSPMSAADLLVKGDRLNEGLSGKQDVSTYLNLCYYGFSLNRTADKHATYLLTFPMNSLSKK